jgi:hypothetical protein
MEGNAPARAAECVDYGGHYHLLDNGNCTGSRSLTLAVATFAAFIRLMLKELEPLVATYARSRETLYRSIKGLTDEQLDVCLPGRDWSIKDTLVHLATNEQLMIQLLQDIANGTNTALAATFDNQKFNDEQVAAGRLKSTDQLVMDLDASYRHLIQVLETLTPEQLNRRGTHPAAGDADVKEFLLAMYAHHEVHTRDVVEQARALKKG